MKKDSRFLRGRQLGQHLRREVRRQPVALDVDDGRLGDDLDLRLQGARDELDVDGRGHAEADPDVALLVGREGLDLGLERIDAGVEVDEAVDTAFVGDLRPRPFDQRRAADRDGDPGKGLALVVDDPAGQDPGPDLRDRRRGRQQKDQDGDNNIAFLNVCMFPPFKYL